MENKVVDGITYHLVRRSGELSFGEARHYWEGENGEVLDLMYEEKESLAKD